MMTSFCADFAERRDIVNFSVRTARLSQQFSILLRTVSEEKEAKARSRTHLSLCKGKLLVSRQVLLVP